MKNFTIFLILATLVHTLNGQVKIGNDILGEGQNQDFGEDIALNDEGNILAIGLSKEENGFVRVFENINGNWELRGSELKGELHKQRFGYALALSPSGQKMVVGCYHTNYTYIYEYQGVDWVKTGEIYVGHDQDTHFGIKVDISRDGRIIAIAETHFPHDRIGNGQVLIFQEVEGNWIQIGDGIEGENEGDLFGWDIELANNGYTIAIGKIGSHYLDYPGEVRVFDFDGTHWVQKGQSLSGSQPVTKFGHSVSISEDGRYIVVGTGGGEYDGYVEIYEFNDNQNWELKGQTVFLNGWKNSHEVKIADHGNRVVVSNSSSVDCPILIFDYINGQWEMMGDPILLKNNNYTLGKDISLTSDGMKVAISGFSGIVVNYDIQGLEKTDCLSCCDMEEEEEMIEEDVQLFLPNAIRFSYNLYQNSVFYAQGNFDGNYSMYIFDRWGGMVYKNDNAKVNDINSGWQPNSDIAAGVYVYLITYLNNGHTVRKNGNVTLIK